MFLQVFGSVLLRPSPPDLFSSGISLDQFKDSLEPSRLIECLALYYVVLLRDKFNMVCIPFRLCYSPLTCFIRREFATLIWCDKSRRCS
jgi:hypothetical protein